MAIRQTFKNDAECLSREKMRAGGKVRQEAFRPYRRYGGYHVRGEHGVGLAAPQVGILRRVFVIDCGDGLVEMVNPEIIETSGEQGGMEGCLSFPGKQGYVVRSPAHRKGAGIRPQRRSV